MEFDVLSIVQMIGGLALFINGMTTMGKGLERAAGSKLEKTLEKMTGNVEVHSPISETGSIVYRGTRNRPIFICGEGFSIDSYRKELFNGL